MHTVILLYERKLYTSTNYWHCPHRTWPIDAVVRALDLRPRRSWVRLLASCFQVTTLGKLFTHMCLCHQAVQYGTVSIHPSVCQHGPTAANPLLQACSSGSTLGQEISIECCNSGGRMWQCRVVSVHR